MGLNEYYGDEAAQYKEYARHEFDKRLDRYIDEMERVASVESEAATENERTVGRIATVEELRTAHRQLKLAQKQASRIMARTMFTKRENDIADGLLKGTIVADDLSSLSGVNVANVTTMYEAKMAVAAQKAIIDGHRTAKNAERLVEVNKLIETSDDWEDKNIGFLYSRETMDRNFEDITEKVKDGEKIARAINSYLWDPIGVSNGDSNRFKRAYSARVRAMKLNKRESVYTQMYGEWQYNSNYAKQHKGEKNEAAEKAQKAADNLAIKMEEFIEQHGKKVNQSKVDAAIPEFHKVYDEIFELLETKLLTTGFKPPEYRGGYFPHYNDSLLIGNKWYSKATIKLLNTVGIKIKAAELPTDIAGLTHTFHPSKRWMGNLLERKGEATTYDAIAGFDAYLENVSDIIFHTDDIQRWRTFENAIRYKYSDAGVQEKFESIMQEDIDEAERHDKISVLFSQDGSQLSHLVQEVRSYTDSLAGKKSLFDRTVEADTGREIYQVMQQVESRIAGNMIAANPGSALTNAISLTQASAEISNKSMLKATRDTLKAIKTDDGFADCSNFLTNRRGYESTHRDTLEVISDKLSKPMYSNLKNNRPYGIL